MEVNKLIRGRVYKLAKYYDGNDSGTLVIFKWMTQDGKWAICNPVGEPSMQDSMCVAPEDLVDSKVFEV